MKNHNFSPRKWHNDRSERIVAMNELPDSSDTDGSEGQGGESEGEDDEQVVFEAPKPLIQELSLD